MRKIISIILALFVFMPTFALASITDTIESEVNLTYEILMRLDVSKDNGATWNNYYAEDSSGEETLVVNGGDELLFRIKVWNNGNAPVGGISIDNTITKPEYFIFNNTFVNPDEDSNSNEFSGDPFGSINLLFLLVPVEDLDFGYESATFSATVKENIPASAEVRFIYEVNPEELFFGGPQRWTDETDVTDISIQDPTGTAISEVRTTTPEPEILGAVDELVTAGNTLNLGYIWLFFGSFLLSYSGLRLIRR